MEEHGFGPGVFEIGQLGVVENVLAEKVADRENDGEERNQVAEGHVGWGVSGVRLVLLCRGVTEADLVLVVKPVAIVWADGDVDDPLHEAALDAGFVGVVGRAVGVDEGMREMGL